MELTVQTFLDDTLEVSKKENVPHLQVILFNVKHLESAIKAARGILTELRVSAPLFEREIRPLKLGVRDLARLPATSETRKQLSKGAKRLNTLRSLITQVNIDLTSFRKAIKSDKATLQIAVDSLREYYNQNPEQPAAVVAAVEAAQGV